MDSVRVDLGCGSNKPEGFIGIDGIKFESVDILSDLNISIPLKSDSVDYLRASHFIEHCNDLMAIMQEIERALKKGAIAEIIVPHRTNWRAYDPTHKSFFTLATFLHFNTVAYIKTRLKLIEYRLEIFGRNKNVRWLNFIPNIAPKFYDRWISGILPIDQIIVKFQKI